MTLDVLVVSNDIVPGMGFAVSAPGLRAQGIAAGLRQHGITAEICIPHSRVMSFAKDSGSGPPPPLPRGVSIFDRRRLSSLLNAIKPRVAIFCNSNYLEGISRISGTMFIYDFFAPKVLELQQSPEGADEAAVAALVQREADACRIVDAVIVNGAKKVPYVRDWLAANGRLAAEVPMAVVNMAMPIVRSARRPRPGEGPLLFFGGYAQDWVKSQMAGRELVLKLLDRIPNLSARILLPTRVDGKEDTAAEFAAFAAHPRITVTRQMPFERLQATMASCDLYLDIFERTPERELSMVTRTVGAIAAGVPVVHPDFTEVSPFISDYEAGWTTSDQDVGRLDEVLEAILLDRAELGRRAENARRLASDIFDPGAAAEPLAKLVRSMHAVQ